MQTALRLFTLTIVALTLVVSTAGRSLPRRVADDREVARFARCVGAERRDCIVDGDTFWYRGARIRLADVNAPELSAPRCPAEAPLARRAALRLTALLNAGAFSLRPADRAVDTYGRRLFTVTRNGASIGDVLTAEGLAERWRGYRRDWC